MTGHAVVLHDARDAIVPGDGRRHSDLSSRPARRFQHTSGRGGGAHIWLRAGERRVQGINEKGVARRIERLAEAVLVINRAAVNDRSSSIEQEHFGRRRRI